MACSKLFLVGRRCNKPSQEGTILDQWLPARRIPVHVFRRRHSCTWLATEKDNNSVRLGRNEAKQKDVFGTAVVTFQDGITERAARMQLNLFMTSADQMVNNVGGGCVAAGTAEPLAAC